MPLELNGFTAWVECRGAELTPYNAERSEDGKSVTCWIASEVGKTFTINYTNSPDYADRLIIMKLIINSTRTVQSRISREECKKKKNRTYLWAVVTSATTSGPFKFADVEAIADDDSLGLQTFPDLGTISMKPFNARNSTERGHSTHESDAERAELLCNQNKTIHERAKKMTSHRTSLSDNTIPCKTSEVPMILEDPGVEFIFRYRPLRVLKAQGIVPSESTPEMHDKPLEPKRKLSSSSETQAAQPSSTISRETVAGSSEVIKEEVSYESEEAAIDTRIKALQDELRDQERKKKIMALRKELAELERDDRPSTSQRPAKKVKKESSVIDLT